MPTHHGNTGNGNSDRTKLIAVRKREGCPNKSRAERTAFLLLPMNEEAQRILKRLQKASGTGKALAVGVFRLKEGVGLMIKINVNFGLHKGGVLELNQAERNHKKGVVVELNPS